MFGMRFIKVEPTTHLMMFQKGQVVREGTGLACFYYAPTTSLVAVPVGSQEQAFIFEQTTADFQTVTVQGQVIYRIAEPRKTAGLLDFSLNRRGRGYTSEDPKKLSQRVLKLVEVLTQDMLLQIPLTEALRAAGSIAARVETALKKHPEVVSLGLEIHALSVLAVRAKPETARALEAEAREAILRAADEAIFSRRNAAIGNERAIRESELETEIAVEHKKRSIREVQLESEAGARRKGHELRATDMDADIALETKRKDFVGLNAENTRTLAEAEAHRLEAVMTAFQSADPRVVQALAATGMHPSQLIAQAFGGIAEKAERIGQLNVSPELLQSLVGTPSRKADDVERR